MGDAGGRFEATYEISADGDHLEISSGANSYTTKPVQSGSESYLMIEGEHDGQHVTKYTFRMSVPKLISEVALPGHRTGPKAIMSKAIVKLCKQNGWSLVASVRGSGINDEVQHWFPYEVPDLDHVVHASFLQGNLYFFAMTIVVRKDRGKPCLQARLRFHEEKH